MKKLKLIASYVRLINRELNLGTVVPICEAKIVLTYQVGYFCCINFIRKLWRPFQTFKYVL